MPGFLFFDVYAGMVIFCPCCPRRQLYSFYVFSSSMFL